MKRILARVTLSISTLIVCATAAFSADPGTRLPVFEGNAHTSDQQRGFMLVYNYYTSSAANPDTHNTRLSITNTEQFSAVNVHLFFVDGATCSISDRYVCLTPFQTMSFLASEQDPSVSGYLVAVATGATGAPTGNNALIGDAYVKTSTGFFGSLGAEAFPSFLVAAMLSSPTDPSIIGFAMFGLPRVLIADSIGSRADGNETLLVINGVGGDFRTSPNQIGNLFGILYNDAEQPHSWNRSGACQLVIPLNNDFPKTAPRFDTVIPSGQTGWMKFWSVSTSNNSPVGSTADGRALLGAVFQRNNQAGNAAGAFQGARNLHRTRLVSDQPYIPGVTQVTSFVFPWFPPNCGSLQTTWQ